MSLLRTVPTRGVLTRHGRSVADVIVFPGAAALLWLMVRLAHGVTVLWAEVTELSTVSTAPAELSTLGGWWIQGVVVSSSR